jgi:DNA-binding NarL/FixJ family response regulator
MSGPIGARGQAETKPRRATFDLMIIDVFMLHLKGFEAIQPLHERAPAAFSITISGCAFSGTESTRSQFPKLTTRLGATRCLRDFETQAAGERRRNAAKLE